MKNDLKEFKPLLKLIKADIKKITIASIIIFLSGLCSIFTGYLNGRVVESISVLDIKNALLFLFIYFLMIVIIDGLLGYKAKATLHKEESKLTCLLGYNTYKKALDLPASEYEELSSGEVINRITNDTNTLSSSFSNILKMFSSLVSSVVILIYIFIKSWIIGLEIIFIIIILYFILRKLNPLLKKLDKARKEKKDNLTSLINESVRGIREIKTLGVKRNLITNVEELIKDIYFKITEEIDLEKHFNIKTTFLKATLECGVFATCVILLYYKRIDLTFFIAMTYYVYRYTWLLEDINDLSQSYQKIIVSLSRVNDILENRLSEDEKFGSAKFDDLKGIIEFKNVGFGYPNEEHILNSFNLKLEPNKKIAIVGSSGQGKSTIFNLLTRVFDPNEGEITIDGINLKDLSEKELRKHISIIRQEPFVFNRTIKENFEIINKDITIEEIRKCTKMAYLDDYIMSLPKKYDTVLGEGGVNLSGGQKQRLSIARTLSKGSKVILFDEATSALDNKSQEYIKKTIDDLVNDHTIVIVAHRLSTIIDADIIYVIDNGKIVSSGTHKELLKQSKIYKTLYETDALNS